MHTCMYVCIYVRMYVYVCTCMYVHMYVYMCNCTYVHIYICTYAAFCSHLAFICDYVCMICMYEALLLHINMQFTEQAGEKLKKACSEFASNQARAERLFKVSYTCMCKLCLER